MMRRTQTLGLAPASAYGGTFAEGAPRPRDGGALPPGWEGLYFPFDQPLADLRADGSPAIDGVLPAIDLPRRMYAGEDTVFHQPLRYGAVIEQTVRAGTITEKAGRGGRLVFADLVREYRQDGQLAIESTWHDVFLEAAPPGTPAREPEKLDPATLDWTEQRTLDERQLFRFSALTFNTHRIHYDRAWARDEEGLDDLLVHGPLLRILLLDAAGRHDERTIAEFRFRAHSPTLVNTPLTIGGAGDRVVALRADGGLLCEGTAGRA